MKQAAAPAVGEAIRRIREERRLSQAELADRARLTQATISRIESGSRRGDIETLALIAAGLGFELCLRMKRA